MLRWLLLAFLAVSSANSDSDSDPEDASDLLSWYFSQLPHHRDKRFIWMSHKKKLILPPGTQLVLTPTLAMPFIRHPPQGLDANLTIATPFTSKGLVCTT